MRILGAAIAATAMLCIAPVQQAFAEPEPVKYVRICEEDGNDSQIYVPNTEDCVNINEGAALSMALPQATIDPGKTYGVGVGFGTYGGATALGIGGAIQAGEGFTLNGAVGVSTQTGQVGGKLGANFSW